MLDNLNWIAPSIIAVLAIIIPLYVQRIQKSKINESTEQPTTFITIISDYQETLKIVKQEKISLQRQL